MLQVLAVHLGVCHGQVMALYAQEEERQLESEAEDTIDAEMDMMIGANIESQDNENDENENIENMLHEKVVNLEFIEEVLGDVIEKVIGNDFNENLKNRKTSPEEKMMAEGHNELDIEATQFDVGSEETAKKTSRELAKLQDDLSPVYQVASKVGEGKGVITRSKITIKDLKPLGPEVEKESEAKCPPVTKRLTRGVKERCFLWMFFFKLKV